MNSIKLRAAFGLGCLIGLAPMTAWSAPPALYTTQQATAGASVFAQNCAMCHGTDLTGVSGPPLVGQAFASASNKYSVGSIFTQLSQQMPLGQAGSLSQDQYTEVFSYILNKNGYPSGSTPLNFNGAANSSVPLVSQVK